ncbi:MAG: adenylate/guanylate cyclase domain-containing protein [Proteobacteria bacterium]|nr:adenylate/guanylate cyclase domain-containing protein [Pseudomonadota bacterium]
MTPCTNPHLVDTLNWLVKAAIDGRSERGLTNGIGRRLVAMGVPVDRISMGSEVLDPVLRSRQFIWRADEGTEKYLHERGLSETDAWQKSILHHMIQQDLHTVHMRLDDEEAQRFTLLPELLERGYQDYYARIIPYGMMAEMGGNMRMTATFATRRAEGFSAEHLALIEAVLPTFALAYLARTSLRMTHRVLETYLGEVPAKSVLSGQIARGQAQSLEAVIWMSDLSGFTRTTEPMEHLTILEYLNAHAEVVADAIHDQGGEILKFIGDGILAAFDGRTGAVSGAEQALNAALRVQTEIASLRQKRGPAGLATSNVTIGLHYGSVLFGNFGSVDRLDFTALGSAVNEASRLVSLGKTLEQTIITSQAFHDALTTQRGSLVSLGRYALRGVSRAQHLYTVDWESLSKAPGTAPPPS